MTNDKTWWDEIAPQVAQGYEVGWQQFGHPTPDDKRRALNHMLDLFGSQTEAWLVPPTIRYQHIEQAESFPVGPDGYTLAVPHECRWAVHGVLKDKPEKGHIPEGVRIPTWDVFRDQFRKSPPLEAYATGTAHSS